MSSSNVALITSVIIFLFVLLTLANEMLILSGPHWGLEKDASYVERFFGRRRDASDNEILTLLEFQIAYNLPVAFCHYILQKHKILDKASYRFIIHVAILTFFFGWQGCAVFMGSLMVLAGVSNLAKNCCQPLIWISLAGFFWVLNRRETQALVLTSTFHPIQLLTAMAWIPLKIVSASVDQDSKTAVFSRFQNTVMYGLYPTNMVFGPFIAYKDIRNMILNRPIVTVFIKCVRYYSLLLLLLFGQHVFHHNAILLFHRGGETGFQKMTCVFFAATFFSTKVISLYGCSYAFLSREFEVQNGIPKCVAFTYDYRNLFKRFDVTLYHFFIRYVVGVRTTKWMRLEVLLRQVTCFSIVCIFHGGSTNIITWCVINFLLGHIRKACQDICYMHPRVGHLVIQVPLTGISMMTSVLFLFDRSTDINFVWECLCEWKAWYVIAAMCIGKKMLNVENIDNF